MTPGRSPWRLSSVLSTLVILSLALAFMLMAALVLLIRLPVIAEQRQAEVARDAHELVSRVEILLGGLEQQVRYAGSMVDASLDVATLTTRLDQLTSGGSALRAVFLVSPQGIVIAAGVSESLRERRNDLLGADLSASALYQSVRQKQGAWSDKYLSALSGSIAVSIAQPVAGGRLLLAEVPVSHLVDTMALAAGRQGSTILLVDRFGEVLADSLAGRIVGRLNLLNESLLRASESASTGAEGIEIDGLRYDASVARLPRIGWSVLAGRPAGWSDPRARETVWLVVGCFVGSLFLALLLVPLGSRQVVRPLQSIIGRAELAKRGVQDVPWPQGMVAELNDLSGNLDAMSKSLRAREDELQAILNAAPVAMAVMTAPTGSTAYVLKDVNEAWLQAFGYQREEVIGLQRTELNIWQSLDDRARLLGQMTDGRLFGEAWLLRKDGQAVLSRIFGRLIELGDASNLIWASIDVTEMRRIEGELRALNVDLEARVAARTRALEKVNEELAGTVATLRQAQGDLVRSEKMAALGGLVAGVAHELNTPIGNGLMAVSALQEDTGAFRRAMQAGLRRSDLDRFVDTVAQASDITTRNLHRAADLVSSFKQVAVDQTSMQRRRFELAEVVEETLTSLRPTLRRTPYHIDVDIAPNGLLLDSYPGPLGQVLVNLINNAVLHGFDGRDHGTVTITGSRINEHLVRLVVADDGKGIPPHLIDRIFEPFVTSKKGQGGTGLGLHIAFNAVEGLLGGRIQLSQRDGPGVAFEIEIPTTAPIPNPGIQSRY